jgi:UDP-N-acetylmuramate--alanine ligase
MSGLAKILLELGHEVSGSDLVGTRVTGRLEQQGAICYTGHLARNIGDAQLVVMSSAIKKDNPELVQAGAEGVPVIHRGDLLALLMKRQLGIAVAGAHGKTTTTSMLALVMENNGLDPTIVVGGELNDIGGNAKLGRGRFLVAEADESDGSFLKLDPAAVIITNVEDDHLDYYGTVEKIQEAFRRFVGKVPPDGVAVLCIDDPGVREIAADFTGPRVFYGIRNQDADYTLRNLQLNGTLSRGEVFFRDEYLGVLELTVPGVHNMSNALGVVAAARWAGMEFNDIARALRTFNGAGRRFQLLGEVRGITVVDDYAHHPSEIKATLEAARQVVKGRIISVFQPHRYTRTSLLRDRFGTAFSNADVIILSDIYSAGEQPIEGVSARLIAEAIEKNEDRPVTFLSTRNEIVDYLMQFARPGDLILTMGAGNIWTAGVDLVNRLQSVEGV